LLDFPERHRGTILGLSKKAIRWHQAHRRPELRLSSGLSLDPATKAKIPPIKVPSDPSVQFLSTVAEIREEGLKMKHCVAQYAEWAVKGACFLFHVNCDGEEATIEVNNKGRVAQSSGPHNQKNRASRWGVHKLAVWGRGFPQESGVTTPNQNWVS
jgi:hypothetical protein